MSEGEVPKDKAPLHMALKDYIDLYKIYRDYAMQESNLINTRLTWILTIHGFLYATYGLTLQKELEVTRSINESLKPIVRLHPICYTLTQAQLFLASITIVGACISLFGLLSIIAAQTASRSVAFLFNSPNMGAHKIMGCMSGRQEHINAYVTADNYILPDIRGGGVISSVRFGHMASLAIPIVLALSWVASGAFLYLISMHNRDIFCSIF